MNVRTRDAMPELPRLPEHETLPDHVLTPPPPPRFDPRPNPWQQRLLLAVFVIGLLAIAVGHLLDLPHARHIQRGGFFAACYALVVAASWLPASVLSQRVDAMLDRWVSHGATGYYGMMALASYAYLEIRTITESITAFSFSRDWIRDALIHWATGFSIESVMNFVYAMAWPGLLWGKGGGGLAPVVLIATTWVIYEGGRRVFPQPGNRRGLTGGT